MSNQFIDKRYTAICSERTLQTNNNGFFMNFVKLVSDNAGGAWINDVFGKIKSDKERIRIIYNNERIKDPLINILSNVEEVYRKKDAEIAQGKRLQGEYCYLQNEFQKSLLLYSQSVIRSPKPNINKTIDSGKTHALALWGRSKVLIQMKEYSYALTDIQLCLKEHLPSEKKAEAYWKMGICYKALGDDNKANLSFSLAEKMLTDKEMLLELESDKNSMFTNLKSKKIKVFPEVAGPKNTQYPNASGKIGIIQSSKMGRYVVANECIKTGDTLVVEQPYAACLLPNKFGTHCHHCFERLVAPVGCPDCSNVAFCTQACKEIALETYHKYECKFLDLLIGSGMSILSHTALRMITQNNLKRCLEIYEDRSKEKVYSLCTNAHRRSGEDFLQRTLMAAFLLRCLQKSGYFGKHKSTDAISVIPTEEEYAIGELLLFHLQVLQFNAHEVFETVKCGDHIIKGSSFVYIGVAIYPTASLFNHDCNPGVTRHYVGKYITIKASRPLKQGESVAENYGPIFARKSLPERQRSLSARYWFNCQCNACLFDWPQLDNGLDDVSKRVKCPVEDCTNFFTLPASNKTLNCPKCKKKVCLTDHINLLNWCEEQYKNSFDKMAQHLPDEIIELLHNTIDTFYRISGPPHKDTYIAQEYLQVCEASFGNMFETTKKTSE